MPSTKASAAAKGTRRRGAGGGDCKVDANSDPKAWLQAVKLEDDGAGDHAPTVEGDKESHYAAQADETCSSIAKKLGVDVQSLVKLNKDRYPALRPHAKLLQDTLLVLPPREDAVRERAPAVAGDDKATGKRRRNHSDAGNPLGLKQDGKWPIVVGTMMSTPVFYPTEEEFQDFYAYMQKLDRLVGHVGVCKVVPPKGWKARPHDLYNLQDSSKELEEAVQVKKPIKQNAIGGKGLYANVHEVKRSMKLSEFKKTATSTQFLPPVDAQFSNITDEEVDLLERRFWRNVLFNPPMYGADCPAPMGLRSDGREGLFDPLTCGDWDLAKLPSLLTHGIKKRVPGVNTPFLYVGMYRAAFAWHCEDMDLHSINYLHWGAPKTWYTVPATHGKKLEELACKHFPVQAQDCKEFLRHKTVMMEPSLLLKANIPLTRTVQRPGEFIINFPAAYHSGFNNGYNCAESCNFATEYWIPFGVQAKPCSCNKDSVRINIASIIKKIGVDNVKVKGEQWVQCDDCAKWRLLPPYLMHLVRDDADEVSAFSCNMIEGMSCSTKQSAAATADDGEAWEIDGKVQLGLNPDLEQWVMCEHCSKWRRLPPGHALDADAAFVCSMLPAVTCQDDEEKADDGDDDRKWELMDLSRKKAKFREWTKEDEKRQQVGFLRDEINAYCIPDTATADCGDDTEALEALLLEVKSKWAARWEAVHARWSKLARPRRGTGDGGEDGHDASLEEKLSSSVGGSTPGGGSAEAEAGSEEPGLLARSEMAAKAACVAQKLWLLTLEAEEERETTRRARDAERRRRKLELSMAEDAREAAAFGEALSKAMGKQMPEPRPAAAGSGGAKREEEEGASGGTAELAGTSGAREEAEDEEWRYACVPVTVISLGEDLGEVFKGLDEKTVAALRKLLSTTAKDVRSIRIPRACSGQQQPSTADCRNGAGSAQQMGANASLCSLLAASSEPHTPPAAAAAAAAAAIAAVSGWKEYATEDGKKYYHHAASRTTQWQPPPAWHLAAAAARSVPAPAPSPQFDMVYLRAMTPGKDTALLQRMLDMLAADGAVSRWPSRTDVDLEMYHRHRMQSLLSF